MRYKPEQKAETYERMVAVTGECFGEEGFTGIDIDGLSKVAIVTSGASYKQPVFDIAGEKVLLELAIGIAQFQQRNGNQWWHSLLFVLAMASFKERVSQLISISCLRHRSVCS